MRHCNDIVVLSLPGGFATPIKRRGRMTHETNKRHIHTHSLFWDGVQVQALVRMCTYTHDCQPYIRHESHIMLKGTSSSNFTRITNDCFKCTSKKNTYNRMQVWVLQPNSIVQAGKGWCFLGVFFHKHTAKIHHFVYCCLWYRATKCHTPVVTTCVPNTINMNHTMKSTSKKSEGDCTW